MIVLSSLFLLFSLGQFGRISFNNQEVNIYLYEFGLFIWISYLFAKTKLTSINPEYLKRSGVLLGVLLTSFLLGYNQVNLHANWVAFLYLARLIFYIAAIPLIVAHGRSLSTQTKERLLIIFASITAGICSLQLLLYPNLRNLQYLGWDPHQNRLFGQFLDASVSGAIVGLMAISLFLFTRARPTMAKKILLALLLLLGLFTYSRGFILSLGVTGMYLVLMQYRNRLPYILALVALVLIFFYSYKPFGEAGNILRSSTIVSRLTDYQEGMQIYQKNLLFGIGYNRIRSYKDQGAMNRGLSHAGASFHSSFLIILVTGGLVGLIAYLYYLGNLFTFNYYAALGGIFLSVFSLFDNILLHPFLLFLFPVLIGLSFTSRKKL